MKSTQISVSILQIRVSGYGAVEIKRQMKTNTLSGFGVTTTAIALFFLLCWGLTGKEKIQSPKIRHAAHTPIIISEILPPPETVHYDGITPPPIVTKGMGIEEIAANPIPVLDELISKDAPNFADLGQMGRASSTGTPGGVDDKVSMDPSIKTSSPVAIIPHKEQDEELPPEGEYQNVEKEPALDLEKLKSFVKYPELARKAGVEGDVLLSALIGADGSLKRVKVAESDNMLLDAAAIQAIKDYGHIPPAIQNGHTVACWIYIPIKFSLH